MNSLYTYLPPIVGAIFGVIIKFLYDRYAEKRRFRKELEDNNHIDVSGEWFAAWQTSVDGSELVNCESIVIVQLGKTAKIHNTEKSPDNPKAGYLWEGQLQFLQGRYLMGWYFPVKNESNASKGIMYLTYFSPKKMFVGKWVGSAYDGDLVSGYVVIKKDKGEARQALEDFISAHPQHVRLIYDEGFKRPQH